MQQLYFVKRNTLEWREVPAPTIGGPDEAIVRPFAAAKCDLDDLYLFQPLPSLFRLGRLFRRIDPAYLRHFGESFLRGPFPFGHECVAEVVETGTAVRHFQPGDVVSVPFQISCGRCVPCAGGWTHGCASTPPLSTYGFGKHLQFGGAVSDLVRVPFADGMLIRLPPDVDPLHLASLSDNVPDAYRTVGPHLERDPARTVLVIGGAAKSIGLYAVAIARSLGSPRVDYVDTDPERRALAHRLGATDTLSSFSQIASRYDIVANAALGPRALEVAVSSMGKGAVCTAVGVYVRKTYFPFVEMYANGGTFATGLSNAYPDAKKVLALIAAKKLDLQAVTTRLGPWAEAIDVLRSASTKVIVHRDRSGESSSTPRPSVIIRAQP